MKEIEVGYTPESVIKGLLMADSEQFRFIVEVIRELEIKLLKAECRALQAELKLKFWEGFEDHFCIGRK